MRSVKFDDNKITFQITRLDLSSRAGCIQPGDRILRINGQSTAGLDLDEVVSIMRDSKPRMTLDVEFDVVDSVVPASGLYWLKLVKPQGSVASYGITLQGILLHSV